MIYIAVAFGAISLLIMLVKALRSIIDGWCETGPGRKAAALVVVVIGVVFVVMLLSGCTGGPVQPWTTVSTVTPYPDTWLPFVAPRSTAAPTLRPQPMPYQEPRRVS